MRPDIEIPERHHGLAKDIRDGSAMDLDEIYTIALRRGLEDLLRDLDERDAIDMDDWLIADVLGHERREPRPPREA